MTRPRRRQAEHNTPTAGVGNGDDVDTWRLDLARRIQELTVCLERKCGRGICRRIGKCVKLRDGKIGLSP